MRYGVGDLVERIPHHHVHAGNAERFDSVNRDIRSMRLHTQINMAFVNPGQEFVTMVNTVLILTLSLIHI